MLLTTWTRDAKYSATYVFRYDVQLLTTHRHSEEKKSGKKRLKKKSQMVRTKNSVISSSLATLTSSLPILRSPLQARRPSPPKAEKPVPEMGLPKCHACGLVMDRQGEKRPSINCKKCKNAHCNQCADVTIDVCTIMKSMGRSLWTCNECEGKDADMKAVLESMKSIKSELCTIKEGQAEQQAERAEQQAERAQVMEGLKAVQAVAKKLEKIETVQTKHEERLGKHDDAILRNTQKWEEGEERLKKLEEQMKKKPDQNVFDMRRCNAVVKEVREVEKRVRNIVMFNVPDSKEKEEKDREKEDAGKVEGVLKELGLEAIRPKNICRIGKVGGNYPQQVLVSLQTVDECESIIKKCGEGASLKDNVFIKRDRTYNQRQEAKFFRSEQTASGMVGQSETGGRGGRSRGRPRGRGVGGRGGGGRGAGVRGGGGRGGRGGKGNDSESRKRNYSDASDEEEAKRPKTAGKGGEERGPSTSISNGNLDCTRTSPTSEHPTTPRQVPDSELGAVGGGETENF